MDDNEVQRVSVRRWGRDDNAILLVTVWAMEFVREPPLEDLLRAEIATAIAAVPGVATFHEEDREVWLVRGDASAEDLRTATTTVVDRHADAIRAHIGRLR